MRVKGLMSALVCVYLLFSFYSTTTNACTGVRLIAEDGSTVYGRSMEWGAFDLNTRVAIIPRGYGFTGLTPEGHNGKNWRAKYGFVGLDMLEKDIYTDAMNEKGLSVGVFYHPGFASYKEYDKAQANNTITAFDVPSYILSQFATIDEVKKGMEGVRVVSIEEEVIGIPAFAHWIVTDPSGKSIVIEYLDKELRIFKNPLGVITNGPTYDWHMMNLRNYVNLSPVAFPAKKMEGLEFAPLGAGSGMLGLPGDFTPPSRFVRAVAWSQTTRPLKNSDEAVYELFRILDNFNLPLGSAEGSDSEVTNLKGMRSSTIWTTGWDLSKKVLHFHTQHNRRVRTVELDRIDFSKKEIVHIPLDDKKEQDVKDITPIMK
ncbi:Choloylglycine hydrolase [subsurface metagenome]